MKYIWLIIVSLLIGCQSSAESSFQSLSDAFISWYYKFHPVESIRFGMGKYHESFRLISNSENEEYVADISRFIIELSQIDATKLALEARIDYHILYFQLEKMRFVMNKIRPWEWNPLSILDEVSEGLYLLSERININMDDRVKAVQGRLQAVPAILHRSKEMMILHSPLHIEHGIRRINGIIRIMDQLPLKLNSDNMTLDEIDGSIVICKEALLNYQEWLNNKTVHMPAVKFPSDLKLLDQAFPYFIGKKYLPEHVYKLSYQKRIPAQNRIFNMAFPIYLTENDEPVWLDRDDTLEVIHWTINHVRNKPENHVSYAGILSHFYNSISSLEKFCNSKGIIPMNVNKRVELAFEPEYIQSGPHVRLFDHHPIKFNSEILYYIKGEWNLGDLFPLTSHEIDLTNARYIIPGQCVQIAHAQKYSSPIRYIFPDPLNEAGWQIYAAQIILDEEFEEWDDVHHILKMKEEVMVICRAFIEGQYYSGNMDRKTALAYLQKEAFLNSSEAEALMLQSDLYYFSGTQAFVGMMEINSILKEYKKNAGDSFSILKFHQEMLENGIISFNQLKKQLVSL